MAEDVTSDGRGDERLRGLMTRYQAGHLDGFDELYGLASPRVRRMLRARVGDPARVEDLVQETFLRLHQARHTYDPAYPVLPWLLAVARHTWLMDLRARSRRPQPTDPIDEATVPSIRGEAEQLPDREEVRRALAALTPAGRGSAVLHHVWGYSFAEIARRTGVNEAAAKLRSSRAIQSLRRLLTSTAEKDR